MSDKLLDDFLKVVNYVDSLHINKSRKIAKVKKLNEEIVDDNNSLRHAIDERNRLALRIINEKPLMNGKPLSITKLGEKIGKYSTTIYYYASKAGDSNRSINN